MGYFGRPKLNLCGGRKGGIGPDTQTQDTDTDTDTQTLLALLPGPHQTFNPASLMGGDQILA